ncbi:MAG: hypothetical protein JW863_21185 [Chitinispirillaceae bacterium]|nr:hypothetical protein [Chitinispirillaceae bacterium]
MQSVIRTTRTFALICTVFTLTTSAQSIVTDPPEREKPYLVLSPTDPVAERDTIQLLIVLGTASNSCTAPTFSNCVYSLEQNKTTIYPPFYTLKVKFTEDPPPADRACLTIYDPVDYGPIFHLGPLAAGTYQVVEETDATDDEADPPVVFGTFVIPDERIIEPVMFSMKGTVTDDPFPLKRASMPVENAVVYLSSLDLNQRGVFETVEQIIAAGLRDSSVTDEQGTYRFDYVSAGTHIVSIVHPQYRMSPVMVSVGSDTTVNFTVISSEASAAVVGYVELNKADNAGIVPVEGCTVSVRKNLSSGSIGVENLVPPKPPIQVVTDGDGYFTVENIPITANGESWSVSASYRSPSLSYSLSKAVVLSNMVSDTADFLFSEPFSNSASVSDDGITFTIAASRKTYSVDEPVEIRYTITNPTGSPVTFGSFSQGCEYDLVISREGDRVVYRESAARVCPDMVSTITVDPGESVTHTFPPFDVAEHLFDILEGAAVAPQTLVVTFSARLMGEEYEVTEAGVPVTIDFTEQVGVKTPRKASNATAVTFNAARNLLAFNFDQPQDVSIAVYTLAGVRIPSVSRQLTIPAGGHTLSLECIVRNRGRSGGVYIVGVRGTGFSKRFRTVHLSR